MCKNQYAKLWCLPSSTDYNEKCKKNSHIIGFPYSNRRGTIIFFFPLSLRYLNSILVRQNTWTLPSKTCFFIFFSAMFKSLFVLFSLLQFPNLTHQHISNITQICPLFYIPIELVQATIFSCLEQEWTHFADGKFICLCGPCCLCGNCSTLPLQHKSSHRQYVSKWV